MSFQTDNLLLNTNKIFATANNVYVTDQNTYTGCLNSWILNGSTNINYNLGGNVGINTPTPTATLDVSGSFKNTQGVVLSSSGISRKLYSYIATGTKASAIDITLTLSNDNFIANIKALALNNDISILETNCFGGTLNGTLPTYSIVASDILVSASTGATYLWNSTINTTTNTVVLSAPSTVSSMGFKVAVELLSGTLSSITNNCDIPTTITYNY
jgi:hypothetical protein